VPELNLYDKNWRIHTRTEQEPPAKFGSKGRAIESLISNGSIINGVVENSVISPGVVIEEGAVVRDSVIFNNTTIKKDSIVCKCIVDKGVVIEENCHVGFGNDYTSNLEKSELLTNGLTVIAKRAHIPANTQIGRNCRILSYVDQNDFEDKIVLSGKTVRHKVQDEVYTKLTVAK